MIKTLFVFSIFISLNSFGNPVCEGLFLNRESMDSASKPSFDIDLIRDHQVEYLNRLMPLNSERAEELIFVAKNIGLQINRLLDLKSGKKILDLETALSISILNKISIWDVIGFIDGFRNTQSTAYKRDIVGLYSDILKKGKPQALLSILLKVQAKHLNALINSSGLSLSSIRLQTGEPDFLMPALLGRTPLTLVQAIKLAQIFNVDPKRVIEFLEDFDGKHLDDLALLTTRSGVQLMTMPRSTPVIELPSLQAGQISYLNSLISKNSQFTVTSVAKAMGVASQAITAMKAGVWILTTEKALEMSRALKISIWKVIGYVGDFENSKNLIYEEFPTGLYSDIASGVAILGSRESLLLAQSKHLHLIMLKYGKHLNQESLGELIGITRESVNRILKGHNLLSLSLAAQIGRVLGINPKMVLAYLEDFDGEP